MSKEAKDLIARMLKPSHDRITLKEIFDHPWMHTNIPITNLKVSFRKMHQYSKFNKVTVP